MTAFDGIFVGNSTNVRYVEYGFPDNLGGNRPTKTDAELGFAIELMDCTLVHLSVVISVVVTNEIGICENTVRELKSPSNNKINFILAEYMVNEPFY